MPTIDESEGFLRGARGVAAPVLKGMNELPFANAKSNQEGSTINRFA